MAAATPPGVCNVTSGSLVRHEDTTKMQLYKDETSLYR